MSRTAYDHEDFKLNEQQEAVLAYMWDHRGESTPAPWSTTGFTGG